MEVQELKDANVKCISGPAILISFKGGSHYIENPEWYLCLDEPGMILQDLNEDYISYKALIAWLKSSIFLFYILQESGSASVFTKQNLFEVALVPSLKIESDDARKSIEDKVDQICNIERAFVRDYNERCKNPDFNDDEQKEMIGKHNDIINKIAIEIDTIFFELFEITPNQIDCIYETLAAEGIYSLVL